MWNYKENWKQISVFSFYISTEATSCIMHCIGNLIRIFEFFQNLTLDCCMKMVFFLVALLSRGTCFKMSMLGFEMWIFLTKSVFFFRRAERHIFVVCTNDLNWRKHFFLRYKVEYFIFYLLSICLIAWYKCFF